MDAKIIINELIDKWNTLQSQPNVFAYRLNVAESRYMKGAHGFYVELNPERMSLRRQPQTIDSLNPEFSDQTFNFKKIKPQETLVKINKDGIADFDIIINASPLTECHSMICPCLNKGLPQRITLEALQFCTEFMLQLQQQQNATKTDINYDGFRIGYNSPGALASVNHLHLHILRLDKELYMDNALLQPLHKSDYIYRLDAEMPTEAICFKISTQDALPVIHSKIQELYKFLIWLCENNRPHNLYMTAAGSTKSEPHKVLKIFAFAREKHCIIKELKSFNIGFCELAGFVTVGDKELFDALDENKLISKIKCESGNVYKSIYKYFENI